jgi:hypothetical protein
VKAAIAAVLLIASSAWADPPKTLADQAADLVDSLAGNDAGPAEAGPQRFGFLYGGTWQADKPFGTVDGVGVVSTTAKDVVIGYSADKTVAWYTTNAPSWGYCGGMDCDLGRKPDSYTHASVLFDRGPKWHPMVWDIAGATTDAQQAKAVKAGIAPPPIAKKIDAGAEGVDQLFESTIGDPAAFAATVSDRKDVVLFGSDAAERFVGGAAVRAKLKAWGLKLAVRDGVQAGLAGSSVAWLAANVDATPAKDPKAKPSPYRLLVIYEKTGGVWKLVHASFDVVTNAPSN